MIVVRESDEDEAEAPDSRVEANRHESDTEASESDSSDADDRIVAPAAAEAQPIEADSSEDLTSEEGAAVLGPSLLHAAETDGEIPPGDTADSDSDEKLVQQGHDSTGSELDVSDGCSDSEAVAAAAAVGDAASGDGDAASGDSEGDAGVEQAADDAATPATGRSSAEPDGAEQPRAASAGDRGEDEQLTQEEGGPAVPAGDSLQLLTRCHVFPIACDIRTPQLCSQR